MDIILRVSSFFRSKAIIILRMQSCRFCKLQEAAAITRVGLQPQRQSQLFDLLPELLANTQQLLRISTDRHMKQLY